MTLKFKNMQVDSPANWEHKLGVRVFFDHDETILEEYANRNSRPTREYNRLIRERVIPLMVSSTGSSKFNYRIVPVPNQLPYMSHVNTLGIEWLPRKAYCVRMGPRWTFRHLDYEIIITVEEV